MPGENEETTETTTDLDDAAEESILGMLNIPRDGDDAEGGEPPPADGQQPPAQQQQPPQQPPPVDPEKQARVDHWRAKINRLNANTQERQAQKQLEQLQQQQQQQQQQFAASQQQLDALAKIGIRPGMTPEQIHERITQATLAENDPKHALALLRREMAEMQQGYQTAIGELKQQLDAVGARGGREAAEKIFRNTIKDPKYEALLDFYEEDELVELGHQMAGVLTKTEGGYTIERIADKILDEITRREKRREERKQQRSGTSQQGGQTAQTGSGPQGGSAQASVLSTATSARKESGERRSTRKERLAAAEQQIGPLLDSITDPAALPSRSKSARSRR